MNTPGDDGQNAPEEDGAERPTWPDEPEDWEPPTILGIEGEYGDIFEQFNSYAEYQSYREEIEERVIEVSLAELIFEGLPKGWCESADPTPHELLAEQIGQIDVEGKYLDFEAAPNLSGKLSTGEAFRLYIFAEFSVLAETRIANRLNRKSFRERLAVYESVIQPTINRIGDRVPPEAVAYVKGERQVLARRLRDHGMDTDALKLPDPEPTPDGSGPPEVVEIGRQMRQSTQQFIQFGRDASTKYAKDELLSILAAAGKDGIFPNEAAENLALKPYYYERDVPDRQDLFHHLYEIPLNRVHSMFIAANEALIDLAELYYDFGEAVDVAADITDWPWYGTIDPDERPGWVQGTKPGRNYAYSWKFATLSIVDSPAPLTVLALPVRTESNAGYLVRRLLRIAESKFTVRRIYLDRGFYTSHATQNVKSMDVDWIIKAKRMAGDIKEMIDEAKDSAEQRGVIDWGVTGVDEDDYAFTVPAEKRSPFVEQVGGDGEDDEYKNWEVFYTNLDPREKGFERLAADYRRRWGIETSYRVIKNKFLPNSGARHLNIRSFIFNYAVNLYNSWIVANLRAANEEGVDLAAEDTDRPYKANHYLTAHVDDTHFVDTDEVENLSDHSTILSKGTFF